MNIMKHVADQPACREIKLQLNFQIKILFTKSISWINNSIIQTNNQSIKTTKKWGMIITCKTSCRRSVKADGHLTEIARIKATRASSLISEVGLWVWATGFMSRNKEKRRNTFKWNQTEWSCWRTQHTQHNICVAVVTHSQHNPRQTINYFHVKITVFNQLCFQCLQKRSRHLILSSSHKTGGMMGMGVFVSDDLTP